MSNHDIYQHVYSKIDNLFQKLKGTQNRQFSRRSNFDSIDYLNQLFEGEDIRKYLGTVLNSFADPFDAVFARGRVLLCRLPEIFPKIYFPYMAYFKFRAVEGMSNLETKSNHFFNWYG